MDGSKTSLRAGQFFRRLSLRPIGGLVDKLGERFEIMKANIKKMEHGIAIRLRSMGLKRCEQNIRSLRVS
jgi:hypothetical protein